MRCCVPKIQNIKCLSWARYIYFILLQITLSLCIVSVYYGTVLFVPRQPDGFKAKNISITNLTYFWFLSNEDITCSIAVKTYWTRCSGFHRTEIILLHLKVPTVSVYATDERGKYRLKTDYLMAVFEEGKTQRDPRSDTFLTGVYLLVSGLP